MYERLIKIREIINSKEDLKIQNNEIRSIEKKFTLFHASLIEDLKSKFEIDVVGFMVKQFFILQKIELVFKLVMEIY